MRGLAAVALALVATAGRPAAALNDPFPAEVIMPDGMGMLYAEVATFGPLPPVIGSADEPSVFSLFAAPTPLLCDAAGLPHAPTVASGSSAVLVDRGNCSFEAKSRAAHTLGYDLVIVRNTMSAALLAENPNATATSVPPVLRAGECSLDCKRGLACVPAANVTMAAVTAGLVSCGDGVGPCMPTGQMCGGGDALAQVCAVGDVAIRMGGSSTDPAGLAPALFVAIDDGAKLGRGIASTGGQGLVVTAGIRAVPTFDVAGVLIWAVAMAVVLVATWRAAWAERGRAESAASGTAPPSPPPGISELPPMRITWKEILALVVCAALMLTGLFVLIGLGVPVVYIVIVMFAFAAVGTSSVVLFLPVMSRVRALDRLRCGIPVLGSASAAELVSGGLAAVLVAVWAVFRQEAWSWVLQDLLGACVCIAALMQVKLPSGKVITLLGAAFLVYDVVMVFITPLIVGQSVMVDVATSGAPTPPPVTDPRCYCRLHPEDTAHCGPGERMPILLAIPHIDDWRGGYAMLGLGDILVPGIAVAYALRLDYTLAGSAKHGYWAAAVVGYGAGLAIANMAVALMQMGQPALLYLIPCVCGALMLMAYARGDWEAFWKGWIAEEDEGADPIDEEGAGTAPLVAGAEDDEVGAHAGATLTAGDEHVVVSAVAAASGSESTRSAERARRSTAPAESDEHVQDHPDEPEV